MTESETGAGGTIVDRLYDAILRGDIEAARACCRDDAVFWHCFDGIAQDLDTACAGWAGLHAAFASIWLEDARRTEAADGTLVCRHTFAARTADGRARGWAACLVVERADGRIARIDEYIDRAGAFPIEG